MEEEVRALYDCCKNHLDLENAELSPEYYYNSLPLCVIDAVFSPMIRYSKTRQIVIDFCNKAGIKRLREHGSPYPPVEEQFSLDHFLDIHEERSFEEIAVQFYNSRHRTSTRSGILKSEACYRFARVLRDYEVNYFQDLPPLIGDKGLELSLKKIPGQKSGVTTKYFYMLAGQEDYIKPDRWITRFTESCLGRQVDSREAYHLIMSAHEYLAIDFPTLTPRELDHEIWKHQQS
jgi:hypothetical protein